MGLPHYSNTIDRPTTHFLSLIPPSKSLYCRSMTHKKCNLLHFLLFYSTKHTIFAVKSEIYYTMKCGNLIKQRRAVLGLTQQDLSDYTGLSLRIIKSIEADKVVYKDLAGETVEVPCDTVLVATGMRPRKAVVEALRHTIAETEVYQVGDLVAPSSIGHAVNTGFDIAAHL